MRAASVARPARPLRCASGRRRGVPRSFLRFRTPRAATVDVSGSERAGEGKVYLIGAGPGGVDNLTVRALRLLRACDVLVYDDLGASDIVDEAPDAEKVYVGKRGGASGSWKQPDIDALLVRLCLEGRVVARLKGGCPSVLSRAHSELDALDAAGCARELVPGVSSALAAPLSADIVLTEKNVGRHFSVASAHDPDALDFTAFAGIDTCVFLMVGRTLEKVVQRLGMSRDEGGAGVPEDVPAAAIRWGCTERETTFRSTLKGIGDATRGEELSPCVLVVGRVAAGVRGREKPGEREG